jgi:hypothetical protein
MHLRLSRPTMPRGLTALAALAGGTLLLTGIATLSTAAAAPPGYVPMSALINADSIVTQPGILKGGTPISLEQYAAERAGYTVTVVSGATWSAMTAAQFAKYQVLIIGDPACDEGTPALAPSVTGSAATWAPVVMGTSGQNKEVGNRFLSGADAAYHYTDGALPTDPANPATAPSEHLVEAGIRFAGARTGATGAYLTAACVDNAAAAVDVANKLSAAGTGFSASTSFNGDAVALLATPVSFPGLAPADLPNWQETTHTAYPTFPADWTALAVATASGDDVKGIAPGQRNGNGTGESGPPKGFRAAADPATCGTALAGGPACGLPVVLYAGTLTQPVVATCKGEKATIVGTPGDDKLQGTSHRDVIVGGGGDDTIKGHGGKDLICAGDGKDKVSGGDGRDRIYGGDGKDKLSGGDGNDAISGGDGEDRIYGGSGKDKLSGGDGDDKLNGGAGKDDLAGKSGDDELNGGTGIDTGRGGSGADTFTSIEKRP